MRKLTVIVPVYNAARTIGRCVDSILAGAPGDLELILVDDGSADGSGGICDARAAADGRVRALHQPNGGVSAARNRGLAEATGEFVAFADADDAVLPGFLPGALALMERFDADLVVGGVREIFRARAFVNAARVYEPLLCEGAAKDSFLRRLISNAPGKFDALPDGVSPDETPAKLYRRSVLASCGAAFPKGVFFGEDALFHLRVFRAARRVVISPDIWYEAYRTEGSLCYGFNDALYDNARRFFSETDAFIASLPDGVERAEYAALARYRRVNWLLLLVKRYTFSGGALDWAGKRRRVRAFLADEAFWRALSDVNRNELTLFKRLFVRTALRGWVDGAMALAAVSRFKEWLRGYRPRGRRHAEA